MNKQSLLIFIILNFIIFKNFAQLDVNHFNLNLVNPAFVGSKDKLSVGLKYSFLNGGIDGAPRTFLINTYAPVAKKISIGLSYINDKVGPVKESIFAVDASYKLNIMQKSVLSFGIKTGYRSFNGNFEQILTPDGQTGTDILISESDEVKNNFNLGVGVYFTFKEIDNHEFSAGLSTPNFLKEEIFGYDIPTNIIQTLSYKTKIVQNIELNVFETMVFPSEGDTNYYLSANIEFKKIIGLGFNLQKNFYGVQLNSPKIANLFRIGFKIDFAKGDENFGDYIDVFGNLDFNNPFN